MRLGITPPIELIGMNAGVELAVKAEALGYDDVWSQESSSGDAFSPLAAVAVQTERVRLGTAIVPAWTRPPALTAMSSAAVQGLSGGRFVLGIGTSSPAIVGRWMSLPFDRFLTRMRESVEVLRELLAGKKVVYEGETIRVDGFRLDLDPGARTPIWMAALGPEMCRLAGRIADGVLFFLLTPDGVRDALEHVAEGAREAGRDPAEIDSAARIPVAVDEPEDVLRFLMGRGLTAYATVPAYNAALRRQGFEEEAAAIETAWTAGDRAEASRVFTEELLDRFLVHGDAAACRTALDAYGEAGLGTAVMWSVSVAGTIEERAERATAGAEALAPGRRGAGPP